MTIAHSTSPGRHDDLVFVGTYGHVLAVDKQRGETLWTASLPSTGWGVVAIVYEDDTLYCASGGRLFALDPKNGHILWTNKMKGLGSGPVYLTTAQSSGTQAAQNLLAHVQKAAGNNAATATT